MRARCSVGRLLAATVVGVVAAGGCTGAEDDGAVIGTTVAPSAPPTTASTSPPTTGPGDASVAEFAPRLDAALAEEFAASPELHGYLALLRSDGGFGWSGVAGDASVDASFRIASVTKMFTAAAVMRLVETGRMDVLEPISALLDPETVALLESAGHDPDTITVGQLLTHTSGIPDFTFGPGADFLGQVLADPQRRWTRAEQVALAMEMPPIGPPGALYHYSDTGYALLGEIIERAAGTTLGAAMHELLRFDELGIRHTYQESIDPVPPDQPARLHQWFGDLDTYGWDPSIDLYGGGGLVSTASDLATFVEALLGGEVFDRPGTLQAMLSIPPTNSQVVVPGNPNALAAASGIFRTDVAGHACWGHEGFWGVQVLRCPDIGLTVVASRSQASPPPTYTGAELGGVVLELIAALDA